MCRHRCYVHHHWSHWIAIGTIYCRHCRQWRQWREPQIVMTLLPIFIALLVLVLHLLSFWLDFIWSGRDHLITKWFSFECNDKQFASQLSTKATYRHWHLTKATGCRSNFYLNSGAQFIREIQLIKWISMIKTPVMYVQCDCKYHSLKSFPSYVDVYSLDEENDKM